MASSYQQQPESATYYPPYGQSLQQNTAAHIHEEARYSAPQNGDTGYPAQSSSYPGMNSSDLPNGAAFYSNQDHVRGESAASYPDSAYATAGSRSRVESEATQSRQQNGRIPPPNYGAPPPPPAGAPPTVPQQQHGGYNQMADTYPTYTNGNTVQNGKPILPADQVGKGWLGFNMQDIRDLSPKAKKRLIW